MKIVIDIDEDYYEIIKHDVKVCHNDYKPLKIIANGTPLPKGHGDLVDRDDLKYYKYNSYAYAIANAPTIIEAESEEEE